jgi:phage shock protein PspC (stress-responsive transcriptional regulator)
VSLTAAVCPHCQGKLKNGLLSDTYRNRPGKQIAGVAIALAEAFGVSVTFIRLVFLVLTFVNLLGPAIYGTLWLLLPAEPGRASILARVFAAVPGEKVERSIFERVLEEIRAVSTRTRDYFRSRRKGSTEPPEGPSEAAEGTP